MLILNPKGLLSKCSSLSCIQVAVFWVVTPCSDVVGNQCFGGPRCCFYLQDEDGDSKVLHNVTLVFYMVSQSRRQLLESSP